MEIPEPSQPVVDCFPLLFGQIESLDPFRPNECFFEICPNPGSIPGRFDLCFSAQLHEKGTAQAQRETQDSTMCVPHEKRNGNHTFNRVRVCFPHALHQQKVVQPKRRRC